MKKTLIGLIIIGMMLATILPINALSHLFGGAHKHPQWNLADRQSEDLPYASEQTRPADRPISSRSDCISSP